MRSTVIKLFVVLTCLTIGAKANGQTDGGQLPVWSPDPDVIAAFPERPIVGHHFAFNGPQWLKFHEHQSNGGHEMFQYVGPVHEGRDAASITVVPEFPNGKNPRSTPEGALKSGEEGAAKVESGITFAEPEHGIVNGVPAIRAYGHVKIRSLDLNTFIYVLGDEFAYIVVMGTDSGPNRMQGLQTLESAALTLTMNDLPKRPGRFDPAPQFLSDLAPASESGGVTLYAPKGYQPVDFSAIDIPGVFAEWSPTPSNPAQDATGNPGPATQPRDQAPGQIRFYGYPHPQRPMEEIDVAAIAQGLSKHPPAGAANYTATPVEVGIAGFGLAARYRRHMDLTVRGQSHKVSEAIYMVYHDGKYIEARAIAPGDDPRVLMDLETAILTAKLPDAITLSDVKAVLPAGDGQGALIDPTVQGRPSPDVPTPGIAQ
jgi:hypothetical protein